ncbi:AF1514 family protein [Thiobacillus thioparus]|uniref:AF1514 family protein n=1 Tax=Thiobacillus thioparus TaxID=931 RepID=UPI00037BDF59|nr:AF1514 family protein [Thiobacillus thioparus]
MRNIHIDYQGPDQGFQAASLLAKKAAKDNQMKDPTIMSWHRSSRAGETLPFYDGADPETWWEKYGEGNGGRLEVSVGDDYQFIMMDTRGFEIVGDMPLRNLTDRDGNPYLCYTPLQGMDSQVPKQEACTLLDGWMADQF